MRVTPLARRDSADLLTISRDRPGRSRASIRSGGNLSQNFGQLFA